MQYYLTRVTGEVVECSGRAVYESTTCPACGEDRDRQIADLVVKTVPEVASPPAVLSVMSGELIVRADVASALSSCGAEFEARPANVLDTGGEWFQVIPVPVLPVSSGSLRMPFVPCKACGGRARVAFGKIELARVEEPGPPIAGIMGATRLIVVSDVALSVLREFTPEYDPTPLRMDGDEVEVVDDGWSDL